MALPYTKKLFLQRIRKHVSDGYADDEFSASDNELLLYIDQSLAQQIRLSAYENAKVEGVLEVPEAFLITFLLSAPVLDETTNEWVTTLPQTPISLPIGYSVTRAYFADSTYGPSQDIILVRAKRAGYRQNLPRMEGVYGRFENNSFRLQSSNGLPLFGLNVYIQMPFSRTKDVNEPMALPDDIIENIFKDVIGMIKDRMGIPKDIIKDDLPAGNKSS